jgi:protein gp37
MANGTKIEWTDETWNPVTGCSKVSQGCKNCYAERDWNRLSANPKTVYWGRKFTDVEEHIDRIMQPLRWTRPRMIFVNSMSDLFHEDVSNYFISEVFATMALAPRHKFQILTKRPERMRAYMLEVSAALKQAIPPKFAQSIASAMSHPEALHEWPLENVWLGVSVENQEAADKRIPILLDTPAAVRWISAEPLLGPVDLTGLRNPGGEATFPGFNALHRWTNGKRTTGIDWVVVGGESGPGARPMHPYWARSLRDQCAAAGVPFLFKQWGEWAPAHPELLGIMPTVHEFDGGAVVGRFGKKAAGRVLDGVEHNEYPEQ